MHYQVLGVEYLTVSDSPPNQVHLHEDLEIKIVWQGLFTLGATCLDLFEVLCFPELPSSPLPPHPLAQVS